MTVFLMSDKSDTGITVKAGNCFSLKFTTNPGSGYSWILTTPIDKKLLTFLKRKNETPANDIMGASEYEIWLFRALSAGCTEIALKYVRPWEKDADPAKEHVFKVTIQ